jgi:hypothetical protein
LSQEAKSQKYLSLGFIYFVPRDITSFNSALIAFLIFIFKPHICLLELALNDVVDKTSNQQKIIEVVV